MKAFLRQKTKISIFVSKFVKKIWDRLSFRNESSSTESAYFGNNTYLPVFVCWFIIIRLNSIKMNQHTKTIILSEVNSRHARYSILQHGTLCSKSKSNDHCVKCVYIFETLLIWNGVPVPLYVHDLEKTCTYLSEKGRWKFGGLPLY